MKVKDFKKELSKDRSIYKIDVLTDMRDAYEYLSYYTYFSALALIFMCLKFIEYLQYLGSINIIVETISKSIRDIIALVIAIMILMVGFAGMGAISFGEIDKGFKDFGKSLITCFNMIIGGYDMSNILEERRIIALVFLFLFTFIFNYIFVNLLIAILIFNFDITKKDLRNKNEHLNLSNIVLCCLIKNSDSKDTNESNKISTINLPFAIAELDKMSIQLDSTSESVRWWAEGLAQQFISERKMRQLYHKQVFSAIIKLSKTNARDPVNYDARDVFVKRKEYLHYGRLTSQFIDFQREAIKSKSMKIDFMLKEKYTKYMNDKKDYLKGEKLKEKIAKELEIRTKEIDEKIKLVGDNEENQRKNEELKNSESKKIHASDLDDD